MIALADVAIDLAEQFAERGHRLDNRRTLLLLALLETGGVVVELHHRVGTDVAARVTANDMIRLAVEWARSAHLECTAACPTSRPP